MFTQEQLGVLKGVVVEAVKPLVDGLEVKLIERMDQGFEKMDEKIDFVDKKVDMLDKKVEEGFKDLQGDIGVVCKSVEKIQLTVSVTRVKLATLEENRPALFVRA